MDSLTDIFGDAISSYSRAQAIEDGVLVDVSTVAKEAGIKHPVAMTRAAFEETVTVPPKLKGLQDEAGRLWDILWLLKCNARRGGAQLLYSVHVRQDRRERTPPKVQLKAMCGPGDDLEPVITIMLPEED